MDELVHDINYAMTDEEEDSVCFHPPIKNNRWDYDRCLTKEKSTTSYPANSGELKKRNTCRKPKDTRSVMRSASILLRSKILILTDSESESDEKVFTNCIQEMKHQPRHPIEHNLSNRKQKSSRKTKSKKIDEEERLFGQLCINQNSLSQNFGKRKRNNTQQNASNVSDDVGMSMNCEQNSHFCTSPSMSNMDCDSVSGDSSSLTDSLCDSDHFVDADDEQSDFYEVISSSPKVGSKHVSKVKYSPSLPIPKNPFASIAPTPSSSFSSLSGIPSSMSWKRRRRNH